MFFLLHLLADSVSEMPVNDKVTTASAPESPEFVPLVDETRELHPQVVDNCRELSADKGSDSKKNNAVLYDDYGIEAIIDKKSDWDKNDDEQRPVFADRADRVVYDVKGAVSCICPATGEQRPMAYWGFEAERETLKDRCPAAAYGFECRGRDSCPGASSAYGKVVRISIHKDRRIFTARDSAA